DGVIDDADQHRGQPFLLEQLDVGGVVGHGVVADLRAVDAALPSDADRTVEDRVFGHRHVRPAIGHRAGGLAERADAVGGDGGAGVGLDGEPFDVDAAAPNVEGGAGG